MLRPPLSAALAPRSVAVIGASSHPASRGYHVWRSVSLSTGLANLWPVNPKYRFVDEHPCFPDASKLPAGAIDLAILCVSRKHLARALDRLSLNPPKAVLFAPQEEGPLSDTSEIAELTRAARAMGARLLGPNSIGVVAPRIGVNASFWPRMPSVGGIALVAQSAMIATGLMDEADEAGAGFSAVVNTGLETDITLAECIEWFARDRFTRVIAVEVAALRDPRAFRSALREAAAVKPVVVLRPGPGAGYAADRLAASRFGTDAGDDRAFDALLASAGALRVRTYEDFCAAAAAFSAGTSPAGGRAAIIANGSGVAALAANAADAAGIRLGRLSNRTIQTLHKAHPGERIPVNPVVIGAGAPGERFAATLATVLEDPGVDGACVVVGPSPFSALDPTVTEIARAAMKTYKPVFISWISGRGTPAVRRQLDALPDSRLIAIRSPELAMRAFGLLAERARRLESLRRPPAAKRGRISAESLTKIRVLCARALESGRHLLKPWEIRALVEALGLRPVPARLVRTLEEAQKAARDIGFPVAIKSADPACGSRSAAGLVLLSIGTPEELAASWETLQTRLAELEHLERAGDVLVERMIPHSLERELRLGIRLDAVLGPVVEFGGVGLASSLFGDVAVGLPPLTLADAERIAREPRVSLALSEYRGMPEIRWQTLTQALISLADLAAAVPAVRELRLEPVVPEGDRLTVLDASAALYDAPLEPDRTFRHLAIRPPAIGREEAFTAKGGARFTLRALTEDDHPLLRDFITTLSESSFYYRFHTTAALSEERIAAMCRPDWSRGGAWALVEETPEGESIAASGRWSRLGAAQEDEAEFGLATRDSRQRLGLARRLLAKLEAEAAAEGCVRISGFVLPGNDPMEAFMRSEGYAPDAETPDAAGARRWSRTIPRGEAGPQAKSERLERSTSASKRRTIAPSPIHPDFHP